MLGKLLFTYFRGVSDPDCNSLQQF